MPHECCSALAMPSYESPLSPSALHGRLLHGSCLAGVGGWQGWWGHTAAEGGRMPVTVGEDAVDPGESSCRPVERSATKVHGGVSQSSGYCSRACKAIRCILLVAHGNGNKCRSEILEGILHTLPRTLLSIYDLLYVWGSPVARRSLPRFFRHVVPIFPHRPFVVSFSGLGLT